MRDVAEVCPQVFHAQPSNDMSFNLGEPARIR